MARLIRRHRPRPEVLIALAGVWGFCLVLGGAIATDRGVSPHLGVAGMAAGMWIFAALVADVVYPRADRRIVWTIEGAALVVLFAAGAAGLMSIADVR